MVLRTLPIKRNLLRLNLGEEGFNVRDSAGQGAHFVVKRLQRRGGGICLLLRWLLSFLGFGGRHDSLLEYWTESTYRIDKVDVLDELVEFGGGHSSTYSHWHLNFEECDFLGAADPRKSILLASLCRHVFTPRLQVSRISTKSFF